jgi:ribosomal protein L15
MMMNMLENAACRGLAAMVLFSGVAAMILIGWLAASDEASAKTQMLTQDTVKRFIASFPAVKAIAVSRATEKGKVLGLGKLSLAVVISAVSDKSIGDQVDKAVQPHGFKNAKEWAEVGESVGRVYAHLKVGTLDVVAKQKLDKAIAKIEKNELIPDKQKQQLVKALRDGAEAALEPPPPENVTAVKPMVAELEAVVK